MTAKSFLLHEPDPHRLWAHALDHGGGMSLNPEEISWNILADWVRDQGLAALAGALPDTDAWIQAAPPPLVAEWRGLAGATRARHKLALTLARRIGRLLEEAEIPHIWLKGPVLQESCYTGWFPRRYDDLDLVVPPERIDEALDLLHQAGYNSPQGQKTQSSIRRFHFHLVLHHRHPSMLKLELHWHVVDFTNLYRIDLNGLLDRALSAEASAAGLRQLGPEDQFLYLCLHLAKHGVRNGKALKEGRPLSWYLSPAAGNRLSWILDIALFLETLGEDLEPSLTKERMVNWNIQTEVEESLALTALMFPGCGANRMRSHLGFPLDLPEPGTARQGRRRALKDRMLHQGQEAHSTWIVRPARLLALPAQLFPPAKRLQAYYGTPSGIMLPLLYLWHPIHLIRKTLARK